MAEAIKGRVYVHRKGGTYAVDGFGEHTETGEEMVLYHRLRTGEAYVRPRSLFEDGRFELADGVPPAAPPTPLERLVTDLLLQTGFVFCVNVTDSRSRIWNLGFTSDVVVQVSIEKGILVFQGTGHALKSNTDLPDAFTVHRVPSNHGDTHIITGKSLHEITAQTLKGAINHIISMFESSEKERNNATDR